MYVAECSSGGGRAHSSAICSTPSQSCPLPPLIPTRWRCECGANGDTKRAIEVLPGLTLTHPITQAYLYKTARTLRERGRFVIRLFVIFFHHLKKKKSIGHKVKCKRVISSKPVRYQPGRVYRWWRPITTQFVRSVISLNNSGGEIDGEIDGWVGERQREQNLRKGATGSGDSGGETRPLLPGMEGQSTAWRWP